MAVNYDKDTDYMKLMQEAEARGDYKAAAQYEQQRNAKIADLNASGTNQWNATTTSDYAGWLDDTDYSQILKDQMATGADAETVAGTLGQRVAKASGTKGLSQYAYDSVYDEAMNYILNQSKQPEFSYETAPAYTNKYQEQINQLYQQILNRDAFSYNALDDPLYEQYRKSYTREGQRAMEDTLGQVAARTGGYASSYAVSAANQANNYYMSQLADKVPELYQLAYSMYQDEGEQMRLNLDMIQALEQGDYAKYQDLLAQYNADRDFAYSQYRDQVGDNQWQSSMDYQTGRDEIEDSRYEDELAYDRTVYEDEVSYERALAKAQNLAAVGDFSGYKALGYSDDEIALLKAAWDMQNLTYSGSGSSGGYRYENDTDDSMSYQGTGMVSPEGNSYATAGVTVTKPSGTSGSLTAKGLAAYNQVKGTSGNGSLTTSDKTYLSNLLNSGTITERDLNIILDKLGVN